MTEIEWHSNLGGFFCVSKLWCCRTSSKCKFFTWTFFLKYRSRSNSNCYTVYTVYIYIQYVLCIAIVYTYTWIIIIAWNIYEFVYIEEYVQDIKGHHNTLSDLNEQHHTPLWVYTQAQGETLKLNFTGDVLGRVGSRPVESKNQQGTLNQSEQIIISPKVYECRICILLEVYPSPKFPCFIFWSWNTLFS